MAAEPGIGGPAWLAAVASLEGMLDDEQEGEGEDSAEPEVISKGKGEEGGEG